MSQSPDDATIILDELSNDSSLLASPQKRASPEAATLDGLPKACTPSTSPQNKSGGNRRKSGHHRLIEDDNISFESVIIKKLPVPEEESTCDESPMAVPSPSSTSVPAKDTTSVVKELQSAVKKRKIEMNLPSIEDFLKEGNSKDESANPNLVLAKKVAFLRVSVNYLMLNLGRSPFDFNRSRTLVELIGEYNMKNRKAAQGNDRLSC